jgi:dihydroorotate dehydrogenase electron transfer subunit
VSAQSASMPLGHRDSIHVEDARVISQEAWPERQYVLRLSAPRCAQWATPGSFVHLSCGADLRLRRPLSIQRVDREQGAIEILYKVVGIGTAALAQAKPGAVLSCLGPIGQGFRIHPTRPNSLLIGGGVGIPPLIFLAETLSERPERGARTLMLMGSEVPFPFRERPSTLLLPGMPAGTIACHPLLESWGVASRLASGRDFPGCFSGFVTDLAEVWLAAQTQELRAETAIYACGPTPMLKACAALARRHGLPAQVALEEFMACGVGGCAGCTVEVVSQGTRAMKRVCVDGPVFDADSVFPGSGP